MRSRVMGRGGVIDLYKHRIGAVIVAAVVAAAAFVYYGNPATEATPVAASEAPAIAELITVHVSGAVVAPGLVEVVADSRVADVIAAAGGTAAAADLTALNLAAPVRDGEQVVVPVLGEAAVGAVDPAGRVHLNRAKPDELEQIPGVGPVLAGRIVAARDERGGFTALEDLLDVPGIGEAKLAALRDYVVVP